MTASDVVVSTSARAAQLKPPAGPQANLARTAHVTPFRLLYLTPNSRSHVDCTVIPSIYIFIFSTRG